MANTAKLTSRLEKTENKPAQNVATMKNTPETSRRKAAAMIGLDYVPLEDHAGHTRSHLPRTALKLLGVMGVAFAGARTLLFSSTGGSKAAFVPEQGVQAVTVKPGPTGPLVLAAPVQAAMDAVHCLFAYGSITEPLPDKAAFAKGITASDAWLYGAKLSGTPFALPTGQAGDIVKGRLLCWDVSEFAGKLSELDKVWSYQADKTGPGAVQRSVASVVQEDGHTTYAHFYYALQAAGAQPTITELFKDTFYPTLEEAGDTLVVVDFFTDWCGPCKLMYPKLLEFAREFPDVKFVKVNANDDFKDIGRVLKIQAAPTFHLYRQNNLLAVMSGAKVDELKQLIITHRSP
eukprot:g35100.t1